MPLLKLIALDAAEVPVVSLHLQDAVVRVADMAYSLQDTRFALMCNRYHRSDASDTKGSGERRRAALRIERVKRVQSQGFDLKSTATVLSILAVLFVPDPDPATAPAGTLTLVCAGNAAVRLAVECVEMALEDLGPAWQPGRRPMHPGA
jgi:Protein of unknown function (DUF2948)